MDGVSQLQIRLATAQTANILTGQRFMAIPPKQHSTGQRG